MAELSRVLVRSATPADFDTVAALLKEAFQEYARLMLPESWESYVQDITDVRGRSADSQLLVADVEGRLAGAVTLYLDGSVLSWPVGWAAIRLLGVKPGYRGKGVGKALMEDCVLRCRQVGIKTIGLHTTEAMATAKRLYEKMGFTRIPEFDHHPAPDVVVMAYKLDI